MQGTNTLTMSAPIDLEQEHLLWYRAVPHLAYHSSTGVLLWDLFYGRAVRRATGPLF
jgi:hypothetical protein